MAVEFVDQAQSAIRKISSETAQYHARTIHEYQADRTDKILAVLDPAVLQTEELVLIQEFTNDFLKIDGRILRHFLQLREGFDRHSTVGHQIRLVRQLCIVFITLLPSKSQLPDVCLGN